MGPDLPQSTELEFRDGLRVVPEYLVASFKRLETHRLTYDEALAQVNRGFENDLINAQHDKIVSAHFRQGPR